MDEGRARRRRGPRQNFRARRVAAPGAFGVAFRLVDGRPGRGVDDEARSRRFDGPTHSRLVGNIRFRASESGNVHAALAGEAEKLLTELAARPEQRDWPAHGATPSRSPA